MRNFRLTIWIFVSILFVVACTNEKINQYNIIDFGTAVDLGEAPMLSDFASSIEYIPLETTPESYLGVSAKVVSDGKNIFVHSLAERKIAVFDMNGKYCSKIERVGNGPQEYMTLGGWNLKAAGVGSVVMVDRGKIKEYSYTGEYIGDIESDLLQGAMIQFIKYNPDGSCYIKGGRQSNPFQFIFKIDASGNLIDSVGLGKITRIQRQDGMVSSFLTMFGYDGTCFKTLRQGSDTIWSYDKDFNKSVAYILDMGKYHDLYRNHTIYPQNFVAENDNLLLIRLECAGDVFSTWSESGSGIFKASNAYLIYDKLNKKTYIPEKGADNKPVTFINDLENGMPFIPGYINNDHMYALVDAITFIDFAEESGSEKMKQIAAGLTEESNHIVVKVTLKQ